MIDSHCCPFVSSRVIFHLHSPFTSALGCLKNPHIEMCHQNSARFLDRVAYDNEYAGIANEMAEGERLGRQLGDKDVLMMCNHGSLVVAPNVHQAFDMVTDMKR